MADTIIDVLRTSFWEIRYFPAHLRFAPMYGVTEKSVSYRTPAATLVRSEINGCGRGRRRGKFMLYFERCLQDTDLP